MRTIVNKTVLITVITIFIASLAFGIVYGIARTVEYGVKVDAIRKVSHWSEHFVEQIPRLPHLLKTGEPQISQLDSIQKIIWSGDVFRFVLFDAQGQPVLVSDQLRHNVQLSTAEESDGRAQQVLNTGQNRITLEKGTSQSDRPDVYVEAYMPVTDNAGKMIGVVEIYLDESATFQLFHKLFSFVALAIITIVILAFCTPYVAYLGKRNQELKSSERARYLALNDQVSNLLNRPGLLARLDDKINEDEHYLDRASVIFLDIDFFKTINDTHGHSTGDAFLAYAGRCLKETLNSGDLAGRIGGDEFMVIAQGKSLEDIHALVDKFQLRISEPLLVDGATIIGHFSIGIHFGNGENLPLEDRMKKADVALYQAKTDGRNVHRTFNPGMEKQTLRRRHVEAAIMTGLEDQRFQVKYQPLLHQKSGKCVGFEALLRLVDIKGDNITPKEFIPVCETMGKIGEIGAWVLEQALHDASTWPEKLTVSVNLSARQFDDGSLVPLVKNLLQTTGVDPDRLELEVTESLLMENTEKVSGQLLEMRELGVTLAMDDFGTGYSSLAYLWQFNFDKLKIDRAFVSSLDQYSDRAEEILNTIIMLGHRLGMTITAEGIETARQAKILGDLECDHFQGSYYGKPMSAAGLAPWLLGHIQRNVPIDPLDIFNEDDIAQNS
ncbi:MAG: GGDEF domain-containing protein [Cohaesibacteraceae bacterium]|nr:GGDEF domain-containing protein [Cohaesibacteraceae bacterium]